jgi:hypothetical protein
MGRNARQDLNYAASFSNLGCRICQANELRDWKQLSSSTVQHSTNYPSVTDTLCPSSFTIEHRV